MDDIVNSATTALRSKRLEYRAFDAQDEELQTFIHTHDTNDPVMDALSLVEAPKPKTKKHTADYIEGLAMCGMIVTINLLAVNEEQVKFENKTAQTTTEQGDMKSNIIGFIGLGSPGDTARHQSAAIMISISAQHQNKGYGSEAINWIVDWGFRYQNLHRISIETVSFNERAVGLYQKLGFTIEGRRRESILYGRKRYDLIDMSMLVREWEALRAN